MSALGLVGYGSSDEEEEEEAQTSVASQSLTDSHVDSTSSIKAVDGGQTKHNQTSALHGKESPSGPTYSANTAANAGLPPAPLGPAQGPSAMPADATNELSDAAEDEAPTSPYTASRALVRNLTMPPVPNFTIPPSPPGSPPPASTAKFAHFLELKKKGVHFNERLVQSSALRNPSMLGKLMDFAGIDGRDQYVSTLPEGMAVRTEWPAWAYGDRLVKEHEKISKKREEERTRAGREAVEFVPAKANRDGGDRGGRGDVRRSRFDDRGTGRESRGGRRSRSPIR